jgi:hypothetical protein
LLVHNSTIESENARINERLLAIYSRDTSPKKKQTSSPNKSLYTSAYHGQQYHDEQNEETYDENYDEKYNEQFNEQYNRQRSPSSFPVSDHFIVNVATNDPSINHQNITSSTPFDKSPRNKLTPISPSQIRPLANNFNTNSSSLSPRSSIQTFLQQLEQIQSEQTQTPSESNVLSRNDMLMKQHHTNPHAIGNKFKFFIPVFYSLEFFIPLFHTLNFFN